MAIQSGSTGSPVARRISLPSLVGGSAPAPAATWNLPAAPAEAPPAEAPQDQPGPSPVAAALASNPFQTDPGYLAALAAEQAGSQQLDAALKAAREQAIVQFGDPSLAQAGGFDLDPLTAAAAQQNTQAGNSTLAQLQRQRDLNQQTIQNQLAAHGIIRSGDLGYKTGQNQQNYGTELYNAQQGVLSGLAGQAQNTLAQKQGLRGSTTQALTSAYNTYVQNPQFWGAAGDQAAQTAAANANAVEPVTAALSPNNRAGPLGAGPVVSRLAAKPMVNAYGAGTARGARPG